MEYKAKLLLVDDDTALLRTLQLYFSRAGYETSSASSGTDGLREMYRFHPDLVILDIMMPQMDGWETCRRIREMSSVPVIILTARSQETDRIIGLRLGADDYVGKPFSVKELEARVEAVLRRVRPPENLIKGRMLYITDDLMIDADRWEVLRNGQHVELTAIELRLLFYLAENAGRVLSHRQILEQIWGPEYVTNTDYVKLFVWRLRKKIETNPATPKYILTERGIGYRMASLP
jgi:two-component system, OmpR family, KDP operon response regulator KdpE